MGSMTLFTDHSYGIFVFVNLLQLNCNEKINKLV